jgi:hypothetical protein
MARDVPILFNTERRCGKGTPLKPSFMVIRAIFLQNTAMASASSSSSTVLTPHPITEKLTRGNFLIWKALVITTLKDAQLSEFLDSDVGAPAECIIISGDKKAKMSNPKFTIFIAKQNQVLNFLLSSLSKVMLEFDVSYTSPQEVWDAKPWHRTSLTPV